MTRHIPSILVTLFCAGCAGMPALSPAADIRVHATLVERSRMPFLSGRWRLVHAIEADLPGGNRTALMGVTEADSVRGSVHAVMMSLEGLVLFEGVFDGTALSVVRAIPPFDAPSFARGMIDDIVLLFFMPRGAPIACGSLPGGRSTCRFTVPGAPNSSDAVMIDVSMQASGWEVRRYPTGGLPGRRVVIPSIDERGLPGTLELRAGGPAGYRLKLSLVEAERIR